MSQEPQEQLASETFPMFPSEGTSRATLQVSVDDSDVESGSHRQSFDSAFSAIVSASDCRVVPDAVSFHSFPSPPTSLPTAGPSTQTLSNGLEEYAQRKRSGISGGKEHRSKVSLDAFPLPEVAGPSDRSVRSASSASMHSRASTRADSKKRRSLRSQEMGMAGPIPARKYLHHRVSMPASSSLSREQQSHSAVTPDFERMDPFERRVSEPLIRPETGRHTFSALNDVQGDQDDVHVRRRSDRSKRRTVSFIPSESERTMSPTFSDDASDNDDIPPRSSTSMPRTTFTDSTLRMTPGVVGLGEGWAGGPQPRASRQWWRKRKVTMVEDDPLALWTVQEESQTPKQSPLKNAWNRSMLAFGVSTDKKKSPSKGKEKRKSLQQSSAVDGTLRQSAAQRAKAFFSRSRLDLAQDQDESESRRRTGNPRNGSGALSVLDTSNRRPSRVRGFFSRSQNDLASTTPSIVVHPAAVDLSQNSQSATNLRVPRVYAKRYAVSQPHLPGPRTSSLSVSTDPFAASGSRSPGPLPPWRPNGSAGGPSSRNSRISEVDESSPENRSAVLYTHPSPTGYRFKRSSTFGNGAEDITVELGYVDVEPSQVEGLPEQPHPCAGGTGKALPALPGAASEVPRAASSASRPLLNRLKSSFTSMRRTSRPTAPSDSSEQTGIEHMTPRLVSHSSSFQSTSPASSHLRTPVIDSFTSMPLDQRAKPMASDEAAMAENKARKRHSWFFGGLAAGSKSQIKLDTVRHAAEPQTSQTSNPGTTDPADIPEKAAGRSFLSKLRLDPRRRRSLGGTLDQLEASADTSSLGDQPRSRAPAFGASTPALLSRPGSGADLLRFSIPRDDAFKGLFDSDPTPRAGTTGLPGSVDVDFAPPREEVLADTMSRLEGRRSTNAPDTRGAPLTVLMRDMESITQTPLPTVMPLSSQSLRALPATPIRLNSPFDHTTRSASPLPTPSSGTTNCSDQPSLATLRPDASTPTARRLNRRSEAPHTSPSLTEHADETDSEIGSVPATFAWASRPGMSPRPSSTSSYIAILEQEEILGKGHAAVECRPQVTRHTSRRSVRSKRGVRTSAGSLPSMLSEDNEYLEGAVESEARHIQHISDFVRKGSLINVQDIPLSARASTDTARA